MDDQTTKEVQGGMVVLQHERNRGPGEFISVNGGKYELDAEGCVSVPPDAAEKLQKGAKWRSKEHWDARRDQIAAATPPPSQAGGARRVRTRDELLAMAEVNGISVEEAEKAIDEPQAISAKDAAARDADAEAKAKADAELVGEETIEVSEDMSKAELLKLAADVGINVNKGMTKAQILDAFGDE